MPLSLLEAMCYGYCCLVSDIAENVDVVSNYGVSFRTNDLNDLVEKLRDMMLNPDKVNSFRENASKYVCDNYNWDEVALRTVRIYYKSDYGI